MNVLLESYGQTALLAGTEFSLKGVGIPTTSDPGKRLLLGQAGAPGQWALAWKRIWTHCPSLGLGAE